MTLANAYAHVLFDEAKREKGARLSHFLDRFTAVLVKKGHASLLPEILRSYTALIDVEKEADTTKMICAREKDFKKYEKALVDITGGPHEARVKKIVDHTLIGGYVIRKGDALYDNSYKKKLLRLFERATIS